MSSNAGPRPVRRVIDFAPCLPVARPCRQSAPRGAACVRAPCRPDRHRARHRRGLRGRPAAADPAHRARRVGQSRARSTSSPRTTRSSPTPSTWCPARPCCSMSSTAVSRSTRRSSATPRVQDAWEVAEAATVGAPPGPTPVVSVPPDVAGLRIVVRSGERVDVVWTVPAVTPAARLGGRLPHPRPLGTRDAGSRSAGSATSRPRERAGWYAWHSAEERVIGEPRGGP